MLFRYIYVLMHVSIQLYINIYRSICTYVYEYAYVVLIKETAAGYSSKVLHFLQW